MSRAWRRLLSALVFFGALAVVHTWPLATAPASLSRHDNGDALLNEWIVAWVQHQVVRDPAHLFDANIFYPEPNALALSEHLFVQSVIGLPLHWAGLSTTAVHNLLIVIGLAMTGWAAYAVVFRWTRDGWASILSGCLMAFNAHTLTRLAHVQAMHVEFLPFAVLALHELMERPRVAAALALAVFFALQGLASNYLLVFTTFALAAAMLARPDGWWGSRGRRLVPHFLLAAAVGALVLAPFLLPYYRAHQNQGLSWTTQEVVKYSASWRDYLSTGGRWHFDLWSRRLWTGTALFPGVVAAALTLAAVGLGVAWRDRRARMWLAVGAIGTLLSFGPAVPGYLALGRVFPLLQGIRAPVRFGFLMLAAVAMLSGFALARLRERIANRRVGVALAAAVLLLATAEAIRMPLAYTPAIEVPSIYEVLAREPQAVVIEYPLPTALAIFNNAPYMLNSTRHWRPMVNGYSGIATGTYRRNWERLYRFTEPATLAALAEMGVTHVVVHDPHRIQAAERTRGLVRMVATPEVAIYRLDPTQIGGER